MAFALMRREPEHQRYRWAQSVIAVLIERFPKNRIWAGAVREYLEPAIMRGLGLDPENPPVLPEDPSLS